MSARGQPGDEMAAFQPRERTHPLDVQALARYLASRGMRLDETRPPRQFASGLANINYLLTIDDRPTVLRRPPDGPLPPGAHDMAREHRVLSRLWRALSLAPRGVALCEDRGIIGVPFQLIEYRPGRVIRGDDSSAFDGETARAAKLADELVDTLIAVHSVDCAAIGLDDLGRPDGFVERAIAGWRRRGERLQPPPHRAAMLDEIGRWLEAERVITRAPVLLHCDFKLDNLILDPDTLSPIAIVDWDMGTRGDPLFDLATLTSYWSEANDPPCMQRLAQMPTAAPGFPSRAEVLERYARATGVVVDDYRTMRVLCMFKLSVVFLQLHALYASGRRSDPHYATFDTLGDELLEFTLDIARGTAD